MTESRSPSPFCASSRTALVATLAASFLAACGGGGSDGADASSAPSTTSTVSTGVMTKGSTIVNGVRFEDTSANISIDDTPKTAAALQNGMVVKVVGTVNSDDVNGTAQRIKALVEVRGRPSSVSAAAIPQTLVLHAQVVFVDDQTVYSNLSGFNAITTATLIEVHGLRDTTGRIRATRIEASAAQMGDNTLDEIRGVVTGGTGTNPAIFSLGAQQINAGAAVIVPAAAGYQNGSMVEVYCTQPCISAGVFQAARLKIEDAQDSAFQPASGQRTETEGLISGFAGHPGNFSVATTPVTTTSSTRFEGGIATDLANNVKVEAEGSWNGTRLVASKIEFKRAVIRLQGNVTAAGLNQFTMNVAGRAVNIETDALTSGAVPPVGPACVQVRGQREVPATPLVVTAGEISLGCSNGDRPVIQAPVEAETSTTITLLGFAIDVSNPTDTPRWEDVNDQPISTLAAFLNAVTPATTNAAGVSVPGTLVKVIFDATNAVRQAEIED
jgi:uncharacterized protein DUF5666